MSDLPEQNDEELERRRTMVGLVAAILLVLVGVVAMVAYKKSSDLLDCVAAGHHNCAPPIDMQPQ